MIATEAMARVVAMSGKVYDMILLIEKGFIENKAEYLSEAMKEETAVNGMEKEITNVVLEMSKSAKGESERQDLSLVHQMAETLERMGDEAANLIERIEIKISERLLFDDDTVAQYCETYDTMKRSVRMMCEFLKKKDAALKERIIDNGFHVKEQVERYRKEHSERLIKGISTAMAANMYFDMLDFTGNLARHSSNIVKLF